MLRAHTIATAHTIPYYDSKPFQKRDLPKTSGRACERFMRLVYSPSMKRVKETTSMVVPRALATSAV